MGQNSRKNQVDFTGKPVTCEKNPLDFIELGISASKPGILTGKHRDLDGFSMIKPSKYEIQWEHMGVSMNWETWGPLACGHFPKMVDLTPQLWQFHKGN